MFFIRSAGAVDMAAVTRLIAACEPEAPRSVQMLMADLARPDSEFVVADNGRRLGGMGYAAMSKDDHDVVILHRLLVDTELEGQGIGRDLFAELETCFPDARRMRLELEKTDQNGQRFFTGLGFAEIGWARQGTDRPNASEVVILEKPLAF